jgi:TolA-binding protein
MIIKFLLFIMVISTGYFGVEYKLDKALIDKNQAESALKDKTISDLNIKINQLNQNIQSNQDNEQRIITITKKSDDFKTRIKILESQSSQSCVLNPQHEKVKDIENGENSFNIYNDIINNFNGVPTKTDIPNS